MQMTPTTVTQEAVERLIAGYEVDGISVIYKSLNKTKGKLKSLSLYLSVEGMEGKVVRVSDHWSDSDYNPNIAPKMKCGAIGRNRLHWSVKGIKGFKVGGTLIVAAAMDAEYYFSIKH